MLFLIDFVNKFCCRVNSNPNRNKRDNVFNVQFSRHVAKSIIKVLYYEKCFSLERKMIKAKSVLLWEPEKRKDLWTEEEYKLLKENTIESKSILLKRRTAEAIRKKFQIKFKNENIAL